MLTLKELKKIVKVADMEKRIPSVKSLKEHKVPYYEEIKDQLDEDEVVTAKDYEIKVGDNFDVKSDYTGLTIKDDSKVKVTFQEAKDTDGNDFSTDYANRQTCKCKDQHCKTGC